MESMIVSRMERFLTDSSLKNPMLTIRGKRYYHFSLLKQALRSIDTAFALEDITFFPYYICDYGMLDLYDVSFAVTVRERTDSSDDILLNMSGKKTVSEIDEETKELISNTCIQLRPQDSMAFLESADRYLNYLEKVTADLTACALLKGRGAIYFSLL